jgi:hypothetical protein
MSYINIAADVEEIAVCSKIEPNELIEALASGMTKNFDNATMTRVQGAVNEVFETIIESSEYSDVTVQDVVNAARTYIVL